MLMLHMYVQGYLNVPEHLIIFETVKDVLNNFFFSFNQAIVKLYQPSRSGKRKCVCPGTSV